MSQFYAIVGLGNPGSAYAGTRHNAGFWFIDVLAKTRGLTLKPNQQLHCELTRCALYEVECLLVKPTLFMNSSGLALRALTDYYKIPADHLLVAYDELDLPPGTVRLKQGGGHGGHNGLRDIFCHLGTRDFLRVRIGIGHPGHKDKVTAYVLSRATREDHLAIETSIDRVVSELPGIMTGDVAGAMNILHCDA